MSATRDPKHFRIKVNLKKKNEKNLNRVFLFSIMDSGYLVHHFT